MHQVSTIGYEGAELASFLATLQQAGIKQVLDIRELPISRRRGFSKNILREALAAAGIGYSHFKALGDPKEGREAMRRGDRVKFQHVYSSRLASAEAEQALSQVIEIASKQSSVLLCYERAHKDCHRAIVANKMEQIGPFVVRHLGVQSFPEESSGRQHAGQVATTI